MFIRNLKSNNRFLAMLFKEQNKYQESQSIFSSRRFLQRNQLSAKDLTSAFPCYFYFRVCPFLIDAMVKTQIVQISTMYPTLK